jgi:hypothetical protein
MGSLGCLKREKNLRQHVTLFLREKKVHSEVGHGPVAGIESCCCDAWAVWEVSVADAVRAIPRHAREMAKSPKSHPKAKLQPSSKSWGIGHVIVRRDKRGNSPDT